MTDDQNPAIEAGDEVVQTEVEEQTEAAEAPESTEGQVEDQPAETDAEGKSSDNVESDDENVSKSKARRERQKAYIRELEGKAKELERLKQVAGKDSPAPVESDFEDYDDYRIAKALYQQQAAQREERQRELSAEQEQIQRVHEQQRRAVWQEQVQEASARYDDFEKVAYTAPISDLVSDLIMDSDVGADVAYFLGSNPAQAVNVSRLPPLEAAREIGRIEAMLAAPKPRTETKAPKPITPVTGRGAGRKDPTAMSYKEFKAWRDGGGTF